MGRTSGNVDIHRCNSIRAIVDFRVIHEWAARDRTGTDRDHDLRGRDGIVGFLEGEPHVLGHRAGNQ